MGKVASAGKIGTGSFSIVSDDYEYDVTITSAKNTIEVKCGGYDTAIKLIERNIKEKEEQNEIDRNY